jgi:hypothetical protein
MRGEQMSQERIHELIEAFDKFDGSYKRQEIEEAVALREEITPHLIRILEELAADPERYIAEEHYANTYAVALLAHFEEPAAHLPIIKAFSFPLEQLDDLWGDMTTETLPTLLFQTCGGDLKAIKELVLDQSVHDYTRGAATEALTYAVARGMADREETVGFLAGLFTGSEAERGGDFWNALACTIADMHPDGAMDAIRKAFADGLIYEGYVGLDDIEADFRKGKEKVMETFRRKVDGQVPTDIHDYLSWFACFRENDRAQRSGGSLSNSQKQKKSEKQAKKKMAKKSKKKNRK